MVEPAALGLPLTVADLPLVAIARCAAGFADLAPSSPAALIFILIPDFDPTAIRLGLRAAAARPDAEATVRLVAFRRLTAALTLAGAAFLAFAVADRLRGRG